MVTFTTAIGNGAVSLNGTSIGFKTKSNLEGLALGNETSALYGGTALGSSASIAENTYSICMPTVLPSATVPMPTAVTVPMDTPPSAIWLPP